MHVRNFFQLIQNGRTGKFGPSNYKCFGPTATVIHHRDNEVKFAGLTYNPHSGRELVFCTEIFEMLVVHRQLKQAVRWINPEFKEKYLVESKELNIDPTKTIDDIDVIDIVDYDDFLSQGQNLLKTPVDR